ncbi:hypothetical protein D6817_02620 [Candidatus Pacearchaeota archaeon]|nr:MAG: hypothetical protein D6817_02620 [Candidatus Pacearchaeota archaeon]
MKINKNKQNPNKSGTQGINWFIQLSLFPGLLWLFSGSLDARFNSFSSSMSSMGQLSGLIGTALMANTLILSSRIRPLVSLFGGIEKLYTAHKWGGIAAFTLLLFHPLFLSLRLLPFSVRSAGLFLLPGGSWEKNLGIAALIIMTITVLVTLFANFQYQFLKFTHKFLGAAFLAGSIHGFFIGNSTATSTSLKIYLAALACAGAIAFLYRGLFPNRLVQRRAYTVTKVRRVNSAIIELTLAPDSSSPSFHSGDVVFVTFLTPILPPESHPFSICSATGNATIQIAIKSVGDYTKQVQNLPVGTKALIEGPYQSFSHKCKNKDQIWIAGGIGITPFLGMARTLAQNNERRSRITLFYSARTERDLAFLYELQQLASRKPFFRIIPINTNKDGRLTAEKISNTCGNLHKKDILMCGPLSMVQSLQKQFTKLKVPRGNIHTAEFYLLK